MCKRLLTLLSFVFCLINAPYVWSEDQFFADNNSSMQQQDEFLPVEEAYTSLIEFNNNGINVVWTITDKYFLYKHGFANSINIAGQTNDLVTELPKGIEKTDEYFGKVEIYHNQVVIPISVPENTESFLIKSSSQGCAEAGLCYPPYSVYFAVNTNEKTAKSISKEVFDTAPSTSTLEATLSTNKNTVTTTKSGTPNPINEEVTPTNPSIWLILFSALLGGIILNLMPCVFPVLSIKVMQLARKHDASATKKQGLAYLVGVVLCFLLIASMMLFLRASGSAVGWGFQLQNPWFISGLVYLFFVLGLSMTGVVTIGTSWMGMGQSLTEKGGIAGSFFTGVLAVVVASPCTAPFMSAALGYAVTQSNFMALLIFATLGLGMALPLTLISFIPAASRLLPKPGVWMERLKEFLAFPLYATAIWLLWVLGNQTSTTGMSSILFGCMLLALTLWCFKSEKIVTRLVGILCLGIAISLPFSTKLETIQKVQKYQHVPFTQAKLKELRQEGKAVFVDLTADWCITCIANEKSTLETAEIQAAFEKAGVVYMVGDWTHYNPEITALLSEYKRSGIPLYLLFPAQRNAEAILLPQILTKKLVLDNLDRISSKH